MTNLTTEIGIVSTLNPGESDTVTMSGPSGNGWDTAAAAGLPSIQIRNLDESRPLSYSIGSAGPKNLGPLATSIEARPDAGDTIVVTVSAAEDEAVPYKVRAINEDVASSPPYQWLQGGAENQSIPSGEWTPLVWPVRHSTDLMVTDRGLDAVETTITAASNGDSLPQGTINVADASGFPTPQAPFTEYAMIKDVSADKWQVVRYTGKTGTTLTGCTLGSITLATGDIVKVAPVSVFSVPTSNTPAYLSQMVTSIIWESSAAGSIRRTRYNARVGFGAFVLDFIVYGNDDAPIDAPAPGQRQQMTGQPGISSPTLAFHLIEVYQDTGADLDVVKSGAESPIIMQSFFPALEAPT